MQAIRWLKSMLKLDPMPEIHICCYVLLYMTIVFVFILCSCNSHHALHDVYYTFVYCTKIKHHNCL